MRFDHFCFIKYYFSNSFYDPKNKNTTIKSFFICYKKLNTKPIADFRAKLKYTTQCNNLYANNVIISDERLLVSKIVTNK